SHALEITAHSYRRMARGGIYDQVGGGFHRYAVDAVWLVPHFEKMLYDNALLAEAYLDACLVLRQGATAGLSSSAPADDARDRYARVLRETLNYVIRDMTDPAGGFYSTEDADSEGHEGLFYTWKPDEIEAVLGDERGATFGRVYDVSDVGNFEGRSILNLPKTLDQSAAILRRDPAELAAELAESREKLFAARERRVRPGRDDKVIVAWNGLMISAMARAGAALNEPEYVITADEVAKFILNKMRSDDGRLLHTYRNGQAKLDAYLDDYASLANSLVTLYEANFDERLIDDAVRLMNTVLEKFADPAGGFFYTAKDHEQLITRTKELTDSSTPSGNALAANALLRLGKLLGRRDYLESAEKTLAAAVPIMERAPMAAGQMLLALDRFLGPAHELVLIGDFSRDDTKAALAAIQRRYLPRSVLAARDSKPESDPFRSQHLDEFFAGKTSSDGQPVLYICQNFACQEPAVGLVAIESQLEQLGKL
ncbi:MAG TPA: thioredoxin domain-containing protein, partial [Lacipirellulaceae bacterium]